MRAALIDRPGNVRVGNIPEPTPNPGELIIRVGACGICGTDLHIVDGDSPLVLQWLELFEPGGKLS